MKKLIKRIIQSDRIKNWYQKYETHISFLALVLGFVADNILLGRVDSLNDLLVLSTYIAISGLCILLLNITDSKSDSSRTSHKHFWLAFCLQFCLGGLFSAYVVFYIRSATLESSWPFLLLLLTYFLGNEFFKKYYLQLSFSLGVYFFALLSYFIIVVPTVLKSISAHTFILSTLVSVFVFSLFVWIIGLYKREQVKANRRTRIVYYMLMLGIVNVFYFLNVIPPLPLILKDVGVYHNLVPKGGGGYVVHTEKQDSILNFLRPGATEVFHRYNNEPVFVYSSVYSPIDLNLNVIHNWQKYDSKTKTWKTINDVIVAIKGGRQGGYRLYSFKLYPEEGIWRVDVLTSDKRLIGRINFEVKNVDFIATTREIQK